MTAHPVGPDRGPGVRTRLVYFGSGAFGIPTLARLLDEHDVALVVSQPDRPAGRRRALTPTPVAAFAAERGLPVAKPQDPAAAVAAIRAAGAGVFVVIAYGHKLGPDLLADVFAINLHASLLPKYRGAAPINWAVMNGDAETGVSVITLAQRMDAGAILARAVTPIRPEETAGELHDRLATLGPDVVLDTLARHAAGALPEPQDDRLATAAPKLRKEDGSVAFDQPAEAVRARIHGLTPWPGCAIAVGGRRLVVRRVEVAADPGPDAAGTPGAITADGVVACRPGAVRLLEVQPPGGRVMDFESYRRGHPVPADARAVPV